MAKNTETKVEKAEVTEIYVEIYPGTKGKFATSKKYSPVMNEKGDKFRYDCQVIVPENDDQAKKFYNLSLAQLIEKGVIQHTYSETITKGLMEDQKASGNAMDDEKFIAKLADGMKTALVWTPRESKASEAKIAKDTVAELYRDYGLDPNKHTNEDLMKAIRKNRTK